MKHILGYKKKKKGCLGLVSMLLLISLTMSITSCKKDDDINAPQIAFEDITKDDIVAKEATLSDELLVFNNQSDATSAIIIFKSTDGLYGKFEIVSFSTDLKITIRAVLYKNNGTISLETSNLEIRDSWLCNLDLMLEDAEFNDLSNDFYYYFSAIDTYDILPTNSALFAVYIE